MTSDSRCNAPSEPRIVSTPTATGMNAATTPPNTTISSRNTSGSAMISARTRSASIPSCSAPATACTPATSVWMPSMAIPSSITRKFSRISSSSPAIWMEATTMPSSLLTRAGDWLNTKLVTPVTSSGCSVRIDSSEARIGSWKAGSSTEVPSGAWYDTTTSPSASRPYASCSSRSAVAHPLSGSSNPP